MIEPKVKITTIHQIRKNPLLDSVIQGEFNEEEQRIAWQTVHLIKQLYPEISDIIRGDIVEEWEEISETGE